MSVAIYKVSTWGDVYDMTPRKSLGYVCGTEQDIRDYFEHKRCEQLDLEEIKVIGITHEDAQRKLSLWNSKQGFLDELKNIDEELK